MKAFFILFGIWGNLTFAVTDEKKITEVKSPQDAMAISSEIQNQGIIPNVTNIMKKHSDKSLSQLLADISFMPIRGYPQDKNLYRVTAVAKGSIYELEGIKVGQLIRTK